MHIVLKTAEHMYILSTVLKNAAICKHVFMKKSYCGNLKEVLCWTSQFSEFWSILLGC